MSQFVISESRCLLYPRNPRYDVKMIKTGDPAKIFKAASAAFSFLFMDVDDTAMADISNITSISMVLGQGGTLKLGPVTLLAAELDNSSITLDQFVAGTHQHARFILTAAQCNLTAGTYDLEVSGFTNEPGSELEADIFGVGTVEIASSYRTAAAPPAVTNPEWMDIIQAYIGGCVKYGLNPPGRTATFVNEANTYGRTLGVDTDGNLTMPLEDYTV